MSKIRFYREGQDEEWVGAGDQHYAYGSNSVRKGEAVLCGHHTCSLTQRAAWGSQDASSCLNLPPQMLSTAAKPTSTGCNHSGQCLCLDLASLVSMVPLCSTAVLRLEYVSTTTRTVGFCPAVAPAALAMTLCLHTWSSEPAVIPGYAAVGVFA